MRSSSDHYPEITIQSNGKTQVRYNITQVTKIMMDKEHQCYDFDYVEVDGELTRAKIIDAIIAAQFTKDAEIALINNEIALIKNAINSPGTEGYKEYQLLRKKAKEIAAVIIT